MKSLITVEQLRAFTGYCEEDKEGLLDTVCQSASSVVIDYLGFYPYLRDYEEFYSGIGDYRLYLGVRNVESVNAIFIDGVEMDLRDIECREDYIYNIRRDNVFPVGINNIRVRFFAGFREIPPIVKHATLRIASLMLQEFDSNIGVTSKSFADQSRTFINYSDYKKYLLPLNYLRIIRL